MVKLGLSQMLWPMRSLIQVSVLWLHPKSEVQLHERRWFTMTIAVASKLETEGVENIGVSLRKSGAEFTKGSPLGDTLS